MTKFNESYGLIKAMAEVHYASRTTDAVYVVRVQPDGSNCTCRGYGFHRSCWHINDTLQRLAPAAEWPTTNEVVERDDEPGADEEIDWSRFGIPQSFEDGVPFEMNEEREAVAKEALSELNDIAQRMRKDGQQLAQAAAAAQTAEDRSERQDSGRSGPQRRFPAYRYAEGQNGQIAP